jgi:hypothetical protein
MAKGAFLMIIGLSAVSMMFCVNIWTLPVTPYLSRPFPAADPGALEAVVLPAPTVFAPSVISGGFTRGPVGSRKILDRNGN